MTVTVGVEGRGRVEGETVMVEWTVAVGTSSMLTSPVAAVAAPNTRWKVHVTGAMSERTRMPNRGTYSAPATAAAYDEGREDEGRRVGGWVGKDTETVYEVE